MPMAMMIPTAEAPEYMGGRPADDDDMPCRCRLHALSLHVYGLPLASTEGGVSGRQEPPLSKVMRVCDSTSVLIPSIAWGSSMLATNLAT